MKKIAAVIALSVASSAASASMVNVTGTLGSWKAWNAASKAPIPYFISRVGVDLVQGTTAGTYVASPAGRLSINLYGTIDSVTGYGTLFQVGSFTGYYDVDNDSITDDSYANSGAGGAVTFSGLSWTLDATGMHQTAGTASGCDSSAPQCAFLVSGVNTNDHGNGLNQSWFDFQGINAGFQTLPRSNAAQTTYGTNYKTWAATPGLGGSWSGSTFTGTVASRINSGSAQTNAANTATLSLNAGVIPPPPNSTTKNWVGANSGLWSTAANWDTASAPVAGDTVNVVQSGSLNRNAIYDNSATSVQLAELNINATGSSGALTFTQNSGDLKATKENIGLGAASYSSSGATTIFIQNGGSHTVGTLNLAYTGYGQARAYANYQLSAGTLAVNTENIGYGGSASFTQEGGTHNVTGSLNIGTSQNTYEDDYGFGSGSYMLNAGNLTASSENIGINGSSGSFTQNGGTHTVGSMKLGEGFPGNHIYQWGSATYTLNAGTLNVGSISRGYYGSSSLYINGGTLNLTGTKIDVGYFALGTARYTYADFTLASGKSLSAETEDIGNSNGVGIFIQSGGTNTAKTLNINQTNARYALDAGSLKVNTINNSGRFTINAGATAIGQGSGGGYDYLGNYQPYVGSTFKQNLGYARINGLLQADNVLIQGGVLDGKGTIASTVTLTGGTLSGGDSGGGMTPEDMDHPFGSLTIDGILNLNGGRVSTSIAGTTSGLFDRLIVTDEINLLSPTTFDFYFTNGFTAQAGDEWLFLAGTVNGSIENMIFNFNGIPQGLNLIVSMTTIGLKLSAVQVQAVPVPAAAWMMGTALVGLAGMKRRKKAA